MEYQKIIHLLDHPPNQPPKFRTKHLVEINDDSYGNYNANSQIRFKTSVLRSVSCDHGDAYIFVNGTITITGGTKESNDANKRLDARKKGLIIKNCAPFRDWISEINNTQIDHAKDLDVVMSMYNLIGYSDNYSKT